MAWPPPRIDEIARTDDTETSVFELGEGHVGQHAKDHNDLQVAVNSLIDQVDGLGDGSSGVVHLDLPFALGQTWTVNHGLGYRPVVDVITNAGVRVGAFECEHLSDDTLVIRFGLPLAGSVLLSA